jgi:YcxB-like protein
MLYKTTLHYNESLIRKAALSFWWRVVGLKFMIAMALIASSLGFCLYNGDRSWFVGTLATVLLIGIIFLFALYGTHYHNGLRKFRAMGSPHATFSASESSFTFESGAGSSTLPWSSVTEIWQFEHYWLMLFSKAQFVTLPLADISPEFRTSILQRTRASGGIIL